MAPDVTAAWDGDELVVTNGGEHAVALSVLFDAIFGGEAVGWASTSPLVPAGGSARMVVVVPAEALWSPDQEALVTNVVAEAVGARADGSTVTVGVAARQALADGSGLRFVAAEEAPNGLAAWVPRVILEDEAGMIVEFGGVP